MKKEKVMPEVEKFYEWRTGAEKEIGIHIWLKRDTVVSSRTAALDPCMVSQEPEEVVKFIVQGLAWLMEEYDCDPFGDLDHSDLRGFVTDPEIVDG